MRSTLTPNWVAHLHGGQLVILMSVLALAGYAAMSFIAPVLWSVSDRAFGSAPLDVYWYLFLGGVALVVSSQLLATTWRRGRRLNLWLSVGLALWLPLVVGTWSLRSFLDANAQAARYANGTPIPALDTMPPGRIKFEAAYRAVAGTYAILLLITAAVALVMLYFWFGERRTTGPIAPPAARE